MKKLSKSMSINIKNVLADLQPIYPEVIPSKEKFIIETFEAGLDAYKELYKTISSQHTGISKKDLESAIIRRCIHKLVIDFKPVNEDPMTVEQKQLIERKASFEDWYDDYLNNKDSVTVKPYEELKGEDLSFINTCYYNVKNFDPIEWSTWVFFKNEKVIMVMSYQLSEEGKNDVIIMCAPDSTTSEALQNDNTLNSFVDIIDNYSSKEEN